MSKDIAEMSVWEIQNYLEKRKMDDYQSKRKAERILKENFQNTNSFEYYLASDYIGMRVGNLEFYYGYEMIIQGDYGAEWCFVAKEDGVEELRIPQSSLWYIKDAVLELYLMSGIAQYMKYKGLVRETNTTEEG